jgi:hypothetical protein
VVALVEAFGDCVVVAALASAGTVVTLALFVAGVVAAGDAATVAFAVRGATPLDGLASIAGGLV